MLWFWLYVLCRGPILCLQLWIYLHLFGTCKQVFKCFSGPQMFKKWYLLNLLKSKISFSFFKEHFYIVISYWEADFPSNEYN